MSRTQLEVDRGRRRQRMGAVVLGLVAIASIALPTIGAPSATAAVTTANGATLTWKVSENAWSSSSLSASHAVGAPTTKDPTNGFVFSQGGGTFDTTTSATDIHFGGSLTLGNEVQGGYKIKLANPHLILDGGPTGRVVMDVSYCESAVLCASPGLSTPTSVVIATFSTVALQAAGAQRTQTITPDFPLQADQSGVNAGRRQFPQALIDALPASLRGHFRHTGGASDPNKAPAAVSIAFNVVEPATTTTSTTTSSTTSSTTSTTSTTSSTTSTTSSTTSSTTTSTLPPSDDIEAGTLDWGVKASFRSYITGTADGTATPGGGATTRTDGTYRFPFGGDGTYASADDVSAAFDGQVRFVGHSGALDITVSDPRVVIDGDAGSLIVDVTSAPLSGGAPTVYDDVAFADLDLSGVTATAAGDQVVIAAVPASLSAAGAPAFAGFYTAGAALDPVTLTLTVDEPGALPPPTATTAPTVTIAKPPASLPRTGSGVLPVLQAGLLALGLGLLLSGRSLAAAKAG